MFLLFGRILLTFIYTENPNSKLFCTSSHMDLTSWNGHQPGHAVAHTTNPYLYLSPSSIWGAPSPSLFAVLSGAQGRLFTAEPLVQKRGRPVSPGDHFSHPHLSFVCLGRDFLHHFFHLPLSGTLSLSSPWSLSLSPPSSTYSSLTFNSIKMS